ncbi:MAG: hypothetical protein ACYTEL_25805 [Planctomycetota bacterium]
MVDDQTKGTRRWKPKFWHVFAAVLLIILAGFVALRVRSRSSLHDKIEGIRAAGYPVTCAELDAWYTIPASADNAADQIISAFSYYCEWEPQQSKFLPVVDEGELGPRTEPLPEGTKTLIRAYLADNQQALELLHEAAKIEHCRYPVNFRMGLATLMPYLSDVRKATQLLDLEAILSAEDAQPDAAVRSIASMFGVARSLSEEPLVISQLVRIACQALAVSGLERVVNRTKLTDEHLRDLGQMLVDAECPRAMSRAFVGERCFGIDVFTKPTRQKMGLISHGGEVPALLVAVHSFTGLLDKEAIIYLDLMDHFIQAGQLPPHQRCEAADAVDARFEKTSKIRIFLRAFMPALAKATELDIRNVARLRSAQVGLGVERYRLASGRLPEKLAELVPGYLAAIPTDPFDGEDIRYRRLEAGYVAYSVGQDQTDDGGKEEPARRRGRRERKNHDITFIIER